MANDREPKEQPLASMGEIVLGVVLAAAFIGGVALIFDKCIPEFWLQCAEHLQALLYGAD